MGLAASKSQPEQIERLLDAARRTIAVVRYCWVATSAPDGGANVRLVLPFAAGPSEDEWTRWFLCNRASRKAAELRQCSGVALAYQQDGGIAYVTLVGRAELVDDPAVVGRFWNPAWDSVLPDTTTAADMLAIRIEVERIEMHVRGVTQEPFGHTRTVIERAPGDAWRLGTDCGAISLARP